MNPPDFATQRILKANVQSMPHSNLTTLGSSIAPEWDHHVAVYIHITCLAAIVKPLLGIMKFILNGRLANSPAHKNQYFSGLK
jgi:hypothetical protein